MNKPKKNIGVVIGRFQTDKLHEGHKQVLLAPIVEYGVDILVVLIGTTSVGPTKNDPLDFATRDAMITEWFLDNASSNNNKILHVFPLLDMQDDRDWAAQVDRYIRGVAGTGDSPMSVIIIGGRDSAVPTYVKNSNQYPSATIGPVGTGLSASLRRKQIAKSVPMVSAEFRKGCIFATQKQYDKCFPVVDIALYRLIFCKNVCTGFEILLGTKSDGLGWRFPGGFVDPSDPSLEAAAQRELTEEIGIDVNVTAPEYVTSQRIDDWRYRDQKDKIMSSLFMFQYMWGTPEVGDDLDGVSWHQVEFSKGDLDIAPNHRVSYEALFQKLRQIYNGSNLV